MPILALMISQHWSDQLGSPDEAEEITPEEIEGRLLLADAMRRAEDFARARVELDKILKVAPDHIPARMARAVIAIKDGQFDEARRELDAVLNHPGLLSHLRGTPDSFACFFRVTHVFLEAKKVDEAETIARRAQDLAIRAEQQVAKSQYNLAQVYAVRGRSDLRFIKQAAEQLSKSFSGRPHLRNWYRDDQWWLEPVKPLLDTALREIEEMAEVHGRMASAPPSRR
jgi:predicted Zn-dependent protease